MAKKKTTRPTVMAGVTVTRPDGQEVNVIVPLRAVDLMSKTIRELWPDLNRVSADMIAAMTVGWIQESFGGVERLRR